MEPKQLEKLRLLTLGDKQDTSQDDLLSLLTELASARFGLYLNRARKRHGLGASIEIPGELSWILIEVVAKRFNRVGSEGFKTEWVEGHKIEFEAADFDDYSALIDDFFDEDATAGKRRPGEVHCY